MFGPPNGNPSPETIATIFKGHKGNARLIAAAPELLQAAYEVESAIQGLVLDAALKAATDKLYAAIRKADGE